MKIALGLGAVLILLAGCSGSPSRAPSAASPTPAPTPTRTTTPTAIVHAAATKTLSTSAEFRWVLRLPDDHPPTERTFSGRYDFQRDRGTLVSSGNYADAPRVRQVFTQKRLYALGRFGGLRGWWYVDRARYFSTSPYRPPGDAPAPILRLAEQAERFGAGRHVVDQGRELTRFVGTLPAAALAAWLSRQSMDVGFDGRTISVGIDAAGQVAEVRIGGTVGPMGSDLRVDTVLELDDYGRAVLITEPAATAVPPSLLRNTSR